MPTKEKEIGKFPVNQSTIAGLVVREAFNDKEHRANITVCVTDGATPKYVNVLISGKERYQNFKDSFKAAEKALGKDDKKKQIKPCTFISGQAFFASNKTEEGVTHQNFTLLASGDMSKNSESFQLTGNKEELAAFRKEFNQQNPLINNVNIRANISNDPKPLEGKNGTFWKLTIAHNYVKQDQTPSVMYANVIVPSGVATQLQQSKAEKGTAILFNGAVQPTSYENKDGKKVYTFNLVTKSLQRDNTNTTSIKKASESIDKVASVKNEKERKAEAVSQKESLKSKPGPKVER